MSQTKASLNASGAPRAGKPLTADAVGDRLRQAAQLRVADRLDETAALYEEVERRNRAEPDPPYFLALIALRRDRPAEALPRLKALSRRRPDLLDVWEALAFTHERLGQWREARAALERALELAPANAEMRFRLAGALAVLGHMDEAAALYRGLAAEPGDPSRSLIALVSLDPGLVNAADEVSMAARAADETAPALQRAELLNALGLLAESRADFNGAFGAFAAAAGLKHAVLTGALEAPPPPLIGHPARALHPEVAARQLTEAAQTAKTTFTAEFLAWQGGQGHPSAAPIFIVGMPRSGSTLIEQILSSHPKVHGLGESVALTETLAGAWPSQGLGPATGADHFRHLAQAYLAAMHARGWVSAPRFVDKTLPHYLKIGMIHLMFPQAVILHSVRDPVDTCLASFRQLFADGNENSYDLAEIGAEYVTYRRMMEHWDAVLPGRVINVDHEALVADPETQIRWLVTQASGLAWDDACLRFHQTRRAVRTASMAQVRRPIFTTAVQRWRRYEKHLGPLLEAQGDYAPR
jgi:Flp pilus assembly protein TadD